MFEDLIARVRAGLAGPLPGPAAQSVLAPRPRRNWPPGFGPGDIRDAAGLLLLFPVDDRAHIVLTVRADSLRHGGQVSLPGGVIEPEETFAAAALREAHEEVALPLRGVDILGALTPIEIAVSGFRLHPIVAATAARPSLRAHEGEVARILEIAVEDLFDTSRLDVVERERDGRALTIPLLRVSGVEIWGATAMVLAEFLSLLGWKA